MAIGKKHTLDLCVSPGIMSHTKYGLSNGRQKPAMWMKLAQILVCISIVGDRMMLTDKHMLQSHELGHNAVHILRWTAGQHTGIYFIWPF